MPIRRSISDIPDIPSVTEKETTVIIQYVDVRTGLPSPHMPLFRQDGKPLGIDQFFDQGEWWRNIHRQWISIADIDARYAGNILRFLERGADDYHFRYCLAICTGPQPMGEIACDAFDNMLYQLEDMNPMVWLKDTDLYKAIAARAEAGDPST